MGTKATPLLSAEDAARTASLWGRRGPRLAASLGVAPACGNACRDPARVGRRERSQLSAGTVTEDAGREQGPRPTPAPPSAPAAAPAGDTGSQRPHTRLRLRCPPTVPAARRTGLLAHPCHHRRQCARHPPRPASSAGGRRAGRGVPAVDTLTLACAGRLGTFRGNENEERGDVAVSCDLSSRPASGPSALCPFHHPLPDSPTAQLSPHLRSQLSNGTPWTQPRLCQVTHVCA